jgi:hypothetical protein
LPCVDFSPIYSRREASTDPSRLRTFHWSGAEKESKLEKNSGAIVALNSDHKFFVVSLIVTLLDVIEIKTNMLGSMPTHTSRFDFFFSCFYSRAWSLFWAFPNLSHRILLVISIRFRRSYFFNRLPLAWVSGR